VQTTGDQLVRRIYPYQPQTGMVGLYQVSVALFVGRLHDKKFGISPLQLSDPLAHNGEELISHLIGEWSSFSDGFAHLRRTVNIEVVAVIPETG
jgi:hypothetical protein